MKKIINLLSEANVIYSDNLPKYPIIGAHSPNNPHTGKSFLVMRKYRDESSYMLMCLNAFEMGNGYGSDASDKAKEAEQFCGKLENILKHPRLEFVLFDTPQELFAWLAV